MNAQNNQFTSTTLDQNESQKNKLEEIIHTVTQQWSLTNLVPLKISKSKFVAKAIMQGSEPVVLKIHGRDKLFLNESNTLTHFQGACCVKLLDVNHEFKVILLEQVTPGLSLSKHESDINEKLAIYSQVVKTLKEKPAPLQAFTKHISTWMNVIDHARDMPHIERRHYEKACHMRIELLNNQREQYVCHGDLHFGNIIQNQDQWVVIDPLGVVAEMEFEVAACNLFTGRGGVVTELGASQIFERATTLSKMLDLDVDRLLAWLYILKFTFKMRMG